MEDWILSNLSEYGPYAVFGLLMLSGVGIALGEEMITIPAGIFIARGELGLWGTAVAAYVGIVLADFLWFGICRHYGKLLLHQRCMKRLIHPRRLLEMKHQLERRGPWFIVFARFIPSSRTTAITVAGMFEMKFWKFALATCVCVLVTAPLQIGLGYLIGRGIGDVPMANVLMKMLGLVMLIVAASLVIGWWTRRRASKHRLPRARASWLRRFRRAPARAIRGRDDAPSPVR